MGLLLQLISKAWPYLLAAALGAAAATYLTSIRVAHVETKYAQLLASQATTAANQQRLASQALQTQLAAAQRLAQVSDAALQDLQQRMEATQRGRDALALRLRNAVANAPLCPAVPEASHPDTTTPAGQAPSQPDVASLCSDVDAEDNDNADQLDALTKVLRSLQ